MTAIKMTQTSTALCCGARTLEGFPSQRDWTEVDLKQFHDALGKVIYPTTGDLNKWHREDIYGVRPIDGTFNGSGDYGYRGEMTKRHDGSYDPNSGKGLIIAITALHQTVHAKGHLLAAGFRPAVGFENYVYNTNTDGLVLWTRVRQRKDVAGLWSVEDGDISVEPSASGATRGTVRSGPVAQEIGA